MITVDRVTDDVILKPSEFRQTGSLFRFLKVLGLIIMCSEQKQNTNFREPPDPEHHCGLGWGLLRVWQQMIGHS